MADGEGESVGCVFGFWQNGEFEQELDHLLDLLLAGRAMADDGKLGFFGGIFKNRDPPFGCSHQKDASGHPQFHRALDIFIDELGFDRNGIGLILVEDFFQSVEKGEVPLGEGKVRRRADAAEVDRLEVGMAPPNHPVPGDARARVDAQNELRRVGVHGGLMCWVALFEDTGFKALEEVANRCLK